MSSSFLQRISVHTDDVIDVRVAQLPLMSTNAWAIACLCVAYLTVVGIIVPNWIKKHKQLIDLRPAMLIYYGFQFGIHGVGITLFFLTMDLSSSWSCQRVNQSPTDVKTMGLIYSSYLLFLVKLFGLIEPVLHIMNTDPSFQKEKNIFGSAVRHLFYLLLVRSAMKSNPGHAFLWIAITDMMVESVYFGYRALTSASPEMVPDPRWKRLISVLRVIQAATLMSHGLFLSSAAKCFMPKSVAFIECVYALLVITLETLAYVQSVVRSEHRQSKRC